MYCQLNLKERYILFNNMCYLLEIKLDDERNYQDYEDSLKLMYGNDNVKVAIDLIEGKEIFHGLHSPGLSLQGFNTHKKLLEGYQKLHKAKQTNWKK